MNHLTKYSSRNKGGKSVFQYKLTGTVELPVLRLRGGTGGDQEKFLCEICGKMLTSKRKLDLHMDSVHISNPDFDCILSTNVVSGKVPRRQTLTQHALIRSIPPASKILSRYRSAVSYGFMLLHLPFSFNLTECQ